MWLVFSIGDKIIDFLGSEGGKERRKGSDEARCTEGILLEAWIKEDRTREHCWVFCDSGFVQGEDQDPLLGGNREGAKVSVVRVVATCETDRGVGSRLQAVEDLEIQLVDVDFEVCELFARLEIDVWVYELHQ